MEEPKINGADVLKNIRYVLQMGWKCDKSMYLFLSIHSLSSAALPFIGVFAPKLIIDELTGARRPERFLLLLGGMLLLSILFSYFSEYCLKCFYLKKECFVCYLQKKLDEKCMSMKFENTEDPNSMNRLEEARAAIMSWGDGMASAMEEVFLAAGSVLSLLGYLWILLTLHPLVILLLTVNVLLVLWLKSRAKNREIRFLPGISTANRHTGYYENVMHSFEYGKDTRIYNMADWLTQRTWKIKKKRISLYYDLMNSEFVPEGANALFLLLREGAVYAYLIYKFLMAQITIGDFTMYFSTVSQFTGWMLRLINMVTNIIGEAQYTGAYRDYLEIPDEEKNTSPAPIPEAPFEVEFQHVRFRYPHGSRDIYSDLNLKIPKGQKLAIVGINGAGKTTFVKLLARLYDPVEGRILINGVDIKKFDRTTYWKQLSVVFQEVRMFAFTVLENVGLCGNPNRANIDRSLFLAGMMDKISSLPKGLKTPVLRILEPDGIEFSGGENQKLALARALYKDGPLVVLDEPTAALDALAENQLYESFNRMVKDKTAIYISHRLASTRFCDKIAFFEDGEILEYGTHDELMALGGKYAEMFEVQARYYRDGKPEPDTELDGEEASECLN